MAITSSAKKALRASKRKQVFNLRRKSAVDKVGTDIRKLVQAKKKAEALKLLPSLYQAVDKAVKTNYFKKNRGARIKSRTAALIGKLA